MKISLYEVLMAYYFIFSSFANPVTRQLWHLQFSSCMAMLEIWVIGIK